MKRLLEQLDSIKAIVDTVSPSQIKDNPQGVANSYELYASAYEPIEQVKTLRDRLIAEIRKGKPVNGYLSADYGYGKTATLVYLWHQCQQKQIVAVPPFKFKELGDLMVASYGWIKACLRSQPELIPEVETLYRKYGLKSQQTRAAEMAGKYKVSEDKVLKIVQELKTDTTNTDSILHFWHEIVPILRRAGFAGLVIFADESQEFLRTEEGSSARIQVLSDLVKGMRALGSTPVGLILSMPTDPTESAIEEQAGDIIHRMQEQKVSLRLADAYNHEFPGSLWDSLCRKFLEDKPQKNELAHPATIVSLGQLCERKDLSNGPRAVIEVFKRLVHFAQDNGRSYTPLDLIQDYLTGLVQLYGTEQHRISNTINNLQQLTSVGNHPRGRDVIRLLAIFPMGVSSATAEEFGLLDSLRELAEDGNLYGQHITQPSSDRFALVSLSENQASLSVLDEILNRFRQRWTGNWNDAHKAIVATKIFVSEIVPLLFPPSKPGQKANWTWRYKDDWKQVQYGFYNFLNGAPERYFAEFPNRDLVVSVGTSELMRFTPPEETHLDWRFHLNYDPKATNVAQELNALAASRQVNFYLQLGRSFERDYPTAFGLLRKVIVADKCSACTLLNLSDYIRDWLSRHPEVSKADLARLEQHRKECHQYALQLLFPTVKPENWIIEGLDNINGAETKLIESVFYQKCKTLFPEYKSFYNSLRPTLLKYKLALEKVSLAARRGQQLHQVSKEEFEKLFETAGSSLPSVLSTLKQCSLISDDKIAGRKEENSQVKFTEHPLESFIQEQLKSRGRLQTVDTKHGRQDVRGLDYPNLKEEVKKLGYLEEEFEEALEWLQRRRYVEWERQRGIIRTSVSEIDSDDLNFQLNEIRSQLSLLIEAFDEEPLNELKQRIDDAQLTLNNNLDDEVILDQAQRTIQASVERIEGFKSGKRSALQKDLERIHLKLESFTKDLNVSKVSQTILGNSGLEPFLNDYRKNLEKQINQLDRDCKNLASAVRTDAVDILVLHHKIEEYNQSLNSYESTKRRLQPLVAGLDQWRTIVNRAGTLRENLTNDPGRLRRYEDDFFNQVVTHFSTNQINSFREYEILQQPLRTIENEINSERRSRRESFDQLLSRYEELLGRLAPAERNLRDRCKFDDEDISGSSQTLKQIFLEKLLWWCSNRISDWEQLERDFSFIAQEREQDVTEILNQIDNLKTEFSYFQNQLPSTIDNIESLEAQIAELKSLCDRGQDFRGHLRKLQFQKDENISDEEKNLLNTINIGENVIAISQLRQRLSDNRDVWELLKTLYKKGHLEITVKRRD
ncbi:MAG TPA: hypothetical protein V6D15_18390 [Oculatellaceae cyanobacterium]|jgi:ribosome recycling factor